MFKKFFNIGGSTSKLDMNVFKETPFGKKYCSNEKSSADCVKIVLTSNLIPSVEVTGVMILEALGTLIKHEPGRTEEILKKALELVQVVGDYDSWFALGDLVSALPINAQGKDVSVKIRNAIDDYQKSIDLSMLKLRESLPLTNESMIVELIADANKTDDRIKARMLSSILPEILNEKPLQYVKNVFLGLVRLNDVNLMKSMFFLGINNKNFFFDLMALTPDEMPLIREFCASFVRSIDLNSINSGNQLVMLVQMTVLSGDTELIEDVLGRSGPLTLRISSLRNSGASIVEKDIDLSAIAASTCSPKVEEFVQVNSESYYLRSKTPTLSPHLLSAHFCDFESLKRAVEMYPEVYRLYVPTLISSNKITKYLPATQAAITIAAEYGDSSAVKKLIHAGLGLESEEVSQAIAFALLSKSTDYQAQTTYSDNYQLIGEMLSAQKFDAVQFLTKWKSIALISGHASAPQFVAIHPLLTPLKNSYNEMMNEYIQLNFSPSQRETPRLQLTNTDSWSSINTKLEGLIAISDKEGVKNFIKQRMAPDAALLDMFFEQNSNSYREIYNSIHPEELALFVPPVEEESTVLNKSVVGSIKGSPFIPTVDPQPVSTQLSQPNREIGITNNANANHGGRSSTDLLPFIYGALIVAVVGFGGFFVYKTFISKNRKSKNADLPLIEEIEAREGTMDI